MMDAITDIERRLDRIERKLFPEKIVKLYDFTVICPNCMLNRTYCNDFVLPKTIVCRCGEDLVPINIWEHEEVVFD
jgi:hypothetical protein